MLLIGLLTGQVKEILRHISSIPRLTESFETFKLDISSKVADISARVLANESLPSFDKTRYSTKSMKREV